MSRRGIRVYVHAAVDCVVDAAGVYKIANISSTAVWARAILRKSAWNFTSTSHGRVVGQAVADTAAARSRMSPTEKARGCHLMSDCWGVILSTGVFFLLSSPEGSLALAPLSPPSSLAFSRLPLAHENGQRRYFVFSDGSLGAGVLYRSLSDGRRCRETYICILKGTVLFFMHIELCSRSPPFRPTYDLLLDLNNLLFLLFRFTFNSPLEDLVNFSHILLDLSTCLCLYLHILLLLLLLGDKPFAEGPEVSSEQHAMRPTGFLSPKRPELRADSIIVPLCDLPDVRVHWHRFTPPQTHETYAVCHLRSHALQRKPQFRLDAILSQRLRGGEVVIWLSI
ncbi:hypothetical protein KC320_g180 [Hortaea werneckii]|nr:hypothetical protein KC320_g180 [Hortaea werneckii]